MHRRPVEHRWFKLTLLVIVAVLAGAAAAELLGQGYFRARNGRWLWQDEAFKTNTYIPYTMSISDRREYTLRPGFHDAITTVDDRGFRLTNPPSRPDDRIIVNIGDSVVFGAGVADADTYSSRLAKLFRAH